MEENVVKTKVTPTLEDRVVELEKKVAILEAAESTRARKERQARLR